LNSERFYRREWRERYDSPGYAFRAYSIRKKLVLASLPPGGPVLELGAGPGVLPELAGRVIALDFNTRLLRQGDYTRVCARNEALPFGDGSFASAIAIGTFEYSDIPAALAETSRVLRPGGFLLASFPNPISIRRVWDREFHIPVSGFALKIFGRKRPRPVRWEIPVQRIRALLASAGFTPERVIFFDQDPLPWPLGRLVGPVARVLADFLEKKRGSPLISNQFLVVARKTGGRP